MSNTVIQIKRSTVTSVPPNGALSEGEQAYSYSSNTLFIGAPDGIGVIAVGGKYYLDTTIAAFAAANAAFLAANSGATVSAAFAAANASFAAANGAFASANAGQATANASFGVANAALASASAGQATANASYAFANSAHAIANLAFTHANGAFASANAGQATANAAFTRANLAHAHANAAFESSNTKLAIAGGTVTGNLAIVGSLTVSGNTYVIDGQNLRISDPLIYLAGNNYVSDIVDIGFIGNYVNATGQNVHTGLYREHENKEYYLFQGYDAEPINNHLGAFSNNMTLAVLNADLKTSNIILGGANAIITIGAAFGRANAGIASANAALASANAGLASANAALAIGNAAFIQANTARVHANQAFEQANTADDHANASFSQANTARVHANVSFAFANSAHAIANLAFNHANGAFFLANSATAQAANATFLTTGTVPSARLSGSYTGITGVGVLTAGTWNASTIGVQFGGTGQTSFTTNGVLFGNGAGALNVTAAGTEGKVLQASASGVPEFDHLDGGTF
jgi:hypothetical protein